MIHFDQYSKDKIPAAINGPTATPRNNTTPATVPIISPVTTLGSIFIKFTPLAPSQVTSNPTAMANNERQLAKEVIKASLLTYSEAMGAMTAMVSSKIPKLSPYC